MKNIRKFETTAEMENAVLEDVSINYNVETGSVLSMPLKSSDVDYSAMYTTFEALEDGTFSFTKKGTGDDIQYSKDNGSTWTSLASGETVSVSTGDKVVWKSTIISKSSYGIGNFFSSNKFNVHGNIMSLLYGDDFVGQTSLEGKGYAFYKLFSGCTQLIDVSHMILIATTLAENSYASMFSKCTSLTTAPELPATTLANNCYSSMFENCSSLTTAPGLSVTELVKGCYSGMFKKCTSLTTAPELPATTLVDSCYSGMFAGCKNLTIAPELPATTLAKYCYDNMFSGCTSMTTAPELPATTLAEYCYGFMFVDCTSLTTAPELPATTLANYCYQRMFTDCENLTATPELPATTLADWCYYDMFSGCTSLTTAPELPATTLTNGCYYNMFDNCTSLTTAPELPATTLVDSCYYNMFDYCKNLNHITMLATDISASKCLSGWVRGVSKTGTFVKHPDMTSLPSGTSGIPSTWTVEDYQE